MKAVLLALLLAGCQTTPAPLVIGSAKPIEIPVVIKEPCLDAAKIPPLPVNAMPARTADVEALANGAAANAERFIELARVQRELLLACAKLQPEKPQ